MSATRPLIGVTMALTVNRPREQASVYTTYLRAVQQAGGVPVLLPPGLDAGSVEALWSRLDGLVVTGGGDVDPARFDEPRHRATAEVAPARDALEIDVTLRALDRHVPLLGICRGIQVMNVALGGSLYQDIPTQFPAPGGSPLVHTQAAPRGEPTHRVKVEDGSRLAGVLGTVELEVNSFHHQALKALGRGLRPVAWSPDGVVEGVEMPEAPGFVLGVQWHPEDLVEHDPAARRLFRALVEAAGVSRSG